MFRRQRSTFAVSHKTAPWQVPSLDVDTRHIFHLILSMKFSKKEILKETKESEEIDNEYDEFVKKD